MVRRGVVEVEALFDDAHVLFVIRRGLGEAVRYVSVGNEPPAPDGALRGQSWLRMFGYVWVRLDQVVGRMPGRACAAHRLACALCCFPLRGATRCGQNASHRTSWPRRCVGVAQQYSCKV